MSIEAMKQARELAHQIVCGNYDGNAQEVLEKLDEALAKQDQGEPVTGVVMREGNPTLLRDKDIKPTDERLYTTPQQRTWVGLTDEEKESLINKKVDGAYLTVIETIELTEAKLKDKNL